MQMSVKIISKENCIKSHVNHIPDPKVFQKAVLDWYDVNKRELPWRECVNGSVVPYYVWLSEIMLQQTVVKTVVPYFERFVSLWPTVHSLSRASEDVVLKEWAGLGYYARARNLLKGAQYVVDEYGGVFPSDAKDLIKISGVGEYTAAAISAIAFSKPATVVDGNIERVISRVTEFSVSPKKEKYIFREVCKAIGPSDFAGRPRDYAQGLMDISSSICRPKNPNCDVCPLRDLCGSFAANKAHSYPIKVVKPLKRKMFGCALIVYDDQEDTLLLETRPDNGLLARTVGVPMTEWFDDEYDLESFLKENQILLSEEMHSVRHVFTHIDLTLSIAFHHKTLDLDADLFQVKFSELNFEDYPTLFKKILVVTSEFLKN